ncbi:hypothetical protein [Streptomyces sp. NPDC000880]
MLAEELIRTAIETNGVVPHTVHAPLLSRERHSDPWENMNGPAGRQADDPKLTRLVKAVATYRLPD